MWLVPRHSRGLSLRTDVPVVVRDALVRWYEGEGTDADHRASVTMVVKARTHGQWIACDCLGGETPPPLMSPSYLSEAETYYLRRLTSTRQKRPEHLTDCPFYREQAPQRFREKRSAIPSTIDEPHGLFNAHRLAPEKLAAMPDEEAHCFANDLARAAGAYLYERRMYATMMGWETDLSLHQSPHLP